MTKTEFLKIILPLAEYYHGKTMQDAVAEVYYRAAKDLPADVFEALIKMHIADPDQGRFFPTFAHVIAQAGTEPDIAAHAGIAFDKKPGIDGTGSFDCQNESQHTRSTRRARYVQRVVAQWKESSAVEKMANSPRLQESLKLEMRNAVARIGKAS